MCIRDRVYRVLKPGGIFFICNEANGETTKDDRWTQIIDGMTITVRYFKEDTAHPEVPAVGNYLTLTGKADRIDPVFRTLQVGVPYIRVFPYCVPLLAFLFRYCPSL